jgi:hypothetical protein
MILFQGRGLSSLILKAMGMGSSTEDKLKVAFCLGIMKTRAKAKLFFHNSI